MPAIQPLAAAPTTIEGYPEVSTMGIGWQIAPGAGGPTWQLQPPTPPGWVSHGTTATLGAPIAVTTATTLTAGTWVVASTGSAAQIVVSDGTVKSPVAGNAYLLTVV
jgi:hypothetical protein